MGSTAATRRDAVDDELRPGARQEDRVSYVFSEPVTFSIAPSEKDGVGEQLANTVETRLNELYTEQDLH